MLLEILIDIGLPIGTGFLLNLLMKDKKDAVIGGFAAAIICITVGIRWQMHTTEAELRSELGFGSVADRELVDGLKDSLKQYEDIHTKKRLMLQERAKRIVAKFKNDMRSLHEGNMQVTKNDICVIYPELFAHASEVFATNPIPKFFSPDDPCSAAFTKANADLLSRVKGKNGGITRVFLFSSRTADVGAWKAVIQAQSMLGVKTEIAFCSELGPEDCRDFAIFDNEVVGRLELSQADYSSMLVSDNPSTLQEFREMRDRISAKAVDARTMIH
jgi:hypothetical protein